ncbi:RluA family pseudouridine synthase [bacterium]|nr:RluA family pseudouridine synthase [bacterium]
MPDFYEFSVTEEIGLRLDVAITAKYPQFSRSLIQKLIKDKKVKVNNNVVKTGYKLKFSDNIEIEIPDPQEIDVIAQNIPLSILYEDDDIIVINKSAGMVVHPAPGNYENTLVNALLFHCKDSLSSINGVLRPGIVHRLDKDTSGVIIAAKNDPSHKNLALQFTNRLVRKEYLAIVHGTIRAAIKRLIKLPIGRHPYHRKKMCVRQDSGKQAVSEFQIFREYDDYTLLKVNIKTGRTHQIRVHLSYIGHPVLGDNEYGNKKKLKNSSLHVGRQMLHAYQLTLKHPVTNEVMLFTAPLPDDMKIFITEGDFL